MLQQIKLLFLTDLRNGIGLMKDKNKRSEGAKQYLLILLVPALFALIIIGNSITLTLELIKDGMANIVPTYLSVLSFLFALILALFRTGPKLYDLPNYERLSALPLKPIAVVISRLLSLYLLCLAASVCVSAGYIVYAVRTNPPFYFYLEWLVVILFSPLLPLAIMEAFSALTTALSSRMKQKNLISVVISMLFILAVFAFTYIPMFTQSGDNYNQYSTYSPFIKALPFLNWISYGMTQGKIEWFLLYILMSIVVYFGINIPISLCYGRVCSSLNSHSASKNYIYKSQQFGSTLKALYKKELSFYLSSNGYLLNSGFGFILSLILAVAAIALGSAKIDTIMHGVNILGRFGSTALAMLFVLSPITASSISMEGKNWWIIKSLPIKSKTLFDAKMASALTIAAPFYVICEILMCIAIGGGIMVVLRTIFVPLVYILFFCVFGITCNLRFPKFSFNNEMEVVKQSAAIGVTTFTAMILCMLPILLELFLSATDIIYGCVCGVMIIATVLLYIKNSKVRIEDIEEKSGYQRIKAPIIGK